MTRKNDSRQDTGQIRLNTITETSLLIRPLGFWTPQIGKDQIGAVDEFFFMAITDFNGTFL